jgi:glutamate dehydrogenase (NAD(P)+)
MEDIFRFVDDIGPAKFVHILEPGAGLKAIVTIDNVAAGPAIGGTRMAPDVSLAECVALARAMTFKNAAAGIPHGGAKSVIFGDPAMQLRQKETIIRAFATAVRDLTDYIPGPDMGTDEAAMAWIKDEIARAVGLPREVGGIPLDEIGSTGFGLTVAAQVAEEFSGVKLKGARLAVQGFGAVGRHVARFLAKEGANLVAAADSRGVIVNPKGLDIDELCSLKARRKSVVDLKGAKTIEGDELIGVDCDIWIPAARPNVIRADNVGRLKAKLVLQGANIPVTVEAEKVMHERGILAVPDFIANAGGVIAAAVEYQGGTEKASFDTIAEKISVNVRAVLDDAKKNRIMPREAAVALAKARVERAMTFQRWHG